MVHDGSLKDRIEHLFNTRVSHSQLIHRVSWGIGMLVAFAALLIAQMQPCQGFMLFEFRKQEPTDSSIVLSSVATDAAGDALLLGLAFKFGTKRFRPATTVDQLLLSPDEKTVVSIGAVLIAWDAQTGSEKWRIPWLPIGSY